MNSFPSTARVLSAQELRKQATWQAPSKHQVETWIVEWSDAAGLDAPRSLAEFDSRVDQHPDNITGATVEIIIELFPAAAEVGRVTAQAPIVTNDWPGMIDPSIFLDPRIPDSARSQLRLAAGCWFARHERFDEAIELLTELEVDEVIDPAALLFYRGMAEHRLMKSKPCIQTLNRLLENEDLIPRRFAVVSRLMKADIAALEDGSLDEVSRLMDDIRRRQALHRSGTRVIDQEKEVIDKLDKLIEEIEQKMQQQQTSQNQQSAQPMQESRSAGGTGKGDVTDREIAEGGDWGSLPPKQRAQALSEMARDLPPHYREVIEEYFRQLAKEKSK